MDAIETKPHGSVLFDALADGALLLDLSFHVTYANRAFVQMTGYGVDALAGQTISKVAATLLEHEVAKWFLSRLELIRKDQIPELDPVVICAKDGRRIPVACCAGFVRDGDKGAIVLVLRDISDARKTEQDLRNANVLLSKALTDLKRTQERVIQSERLNAVGQMASGIAHDFNNLLMPILGFSEILIKRPQIMDDKVEAVSMLNDIHAAAKDATEIIRRLRDFYRQPEPTGWARVDLNKVAESVVVLTQPRWRGVARSRGICIDIQQKLQDIPHVQANESQVREALTNLMLNAIDAMTKAGMITISTRSDEHWATVTVEDTGEGMSLDVQRKVFEPFFTTKGVNGTGMGLAVTYGIVRQHGGKVEFRSELGKGTSFDLHFALKRNGGSESDKVEKGKIHSAALRVLCVDDDPWSRDVMNHFLSAEGHSVVVAESGTAGVAAFKKDQFDLVILDRAMPDMSGDDVAKIIKKVQPDIAVLLVTGFGEIMRNAGESPEGVDAILSKPVSLEDLNRAIAQVMEKQRKSRAIDETCLPSAVRSTD